MSNKSASFVAFIFGAAVGAAVAWRFAKNRYEQIAQEEIDSVREAFAKKPVTVLNHFHSDPKGDNAEETNAREKANKAKEKPGVTEYAAKLRGTSHTNYSDAVGDSKPDEEEKDMDVGAPYTIPPENFGEIEEYEKISLTYYADGVLTDDENDIMDDVDGTVGQYSLTQFGEYEDDSVFVRNDRLKCDYEILLDPRSYLDITLKPYKPEE